MSGPEIKMEEVMPKMARRKGLDAAQSKRKRITVDPAIDDRRRCKKNYPFVLSCIILYP